MRTKSSQTRAVETGSRFALRGGVISREGGDAGYLGATLVRWAPVLPIESIVRTSADLSNEQNRGGVRRH